MSTWVGSLTVLSEEEETRMYITYVCPNGGPDKLFGIALWNEEKQVNIGSIWISLQPLARLMATPPRYLVLMAL